MSGSLALAASFLFFFQWITRGRSPIERHRRIVTASWVWPIAVAVVVSAGQICPQDALAQTVDNDTEDKMTFDIKRVQPPNSAPSAAYSSPS